MDDAEMEAMGSDSDSWDAVSARGPAEPDGEDDLYYIPPSRPDLDLYQDPMDTNQLAEPPALSYMSMTSEDDSTVEDEDKFSTRVQLQRADSFSSCYSLDSDDCEKLIPKVKVREEAVVESFELISDPIENRHPSLTLDFCFKALCETLRRLSEGEIKAFQKTLWKCYPKVFSTPQSVEVVDVVDVVDQLLRHYSIERALQITNTVLERIGKKKLTDHLQSLRIQNEVRYDLRATLKQKYGEVFEGFTTQGKKRPFDEVYTDLFITSTGDNGPNIEHEILKIQKLDTNNDARKLLSTKDIMSTEELKHTNTKLVLLSGVAGSGKSMAVNRLILDWCETQAHQNVSLLFPLPFRELRQFEGAEVSLLDILETVYPETKKLRREDYMSDDCVIMFIFDGLDEYKAELDFKNTCLMSDYRDRTTLNCIVVNLLRGKLFHRGLFLVVSRPQVKTCIPWDTHYDEIEVRGFLDPQREEFFKKWFEEPTQAATVISYINSVQTLRVMCHLPLFCTLVADEYQRRFQRPEPPPTPTYMYTKLLLLLLRHGRTTRAPVLGPGEERELLMKLGKLAFEMLEQSNFKVREQDWNNLGISGEEAVVNSGLCMPYLTKPFILFHERVFSFIHPTLQEYLAALYVFLSCRDQGKNVFEKQSRGLFSQKAKGSKWTELHRSTVDRSLQHADGRLDIFLRFLLGLTLHQELLQPFATSKTSSVKWPHVVRDAAALIRSKMSENVNPERKDNLRRCLEELSAGATVS